mmetsp:Transcript_25307/g.35457  ORF Transcript_25307/g.35457 Transcript_25307/m.35457 type:complete len:153 (-) Transcript_25307:45-503(-)
MGPKQETKKPAAAPAKEAAKPAAKAAAKSAAKPAKPAGERKAIPSNFQLAVGLKKGRAIQKRTARAKPVSRKGVAGKRAKVVREVVREVAGYAPYEKRLLELLRNGLEKRAVKFAKKKLGTLTRAKRKYNEMTDALRKIREARLKEAAEKKD